VFGIANVLPFLDHRLVEFMFRGAAEPQVQGRRDEAHAARGDERRPSGDDAHARQEDGLERARPPVVLLRRGRDTLQDLIGSRRFRERGIYRVAEVERLLAEHEEIVSGSQRRDNHMMFFWQLVNMSAWLDWVDALPAAA
jgi:asparagine synthase (glutamine-hydrolysing)